MAAGTNARTFVGRSSTSIEMATPAAAAHLALSRPFRAAMIAIVVQASEGTSLIACSDMKRYRGLRPTIAAPRRDQRRPRPSIRPRR